MAKKNSVPAPVERQELEDAKGKPRRDIEFRRGWNACRRVMLEHYEKLWHENEANKTTLEAQEGDSCIGPQ